MIALCAAYNWDYMVVLPRGCLTTVWQEVDGLRRLDRDGDCQHRGRWGDREQLFAWVNAIEYEWVGDGHRHRCGVHVALCEETWTDSAGVAHHASWAWLSGKPLNPRNIVDRCNRAGRHRWVIEAAFLVEKRHGDHYEHAFSYDWTAMKGWHYLMQIAHLLNVLTLWTAVGQTLARRYGYQGTLQFLRDTWTGRWLSALFLRQHRIGCLAP